MSIASRITRLEVALGEDEAQRMLQHMQELARRVDVPLRQHRRGRGRGRRRPSRRLATWTKTERGHHCPELRPSSRRRTG